MIADARSDFSANLAAFAAEKISLAAKYPRELLTKREFHLPFLDVAAWFSDPAFARLCDIGLATGKRRDDRVAKTLEILVTNATEQCEHETTQWSETRISVRDFKRDLASVGLHGSYAHEYRFWQLFDPVAGIGIQHAAVAGKYPPWEASSPLFKFLHWAYDALGMRLAHGATLGIDGRGVLLAGSGGSGKSGTTLAGILHGLTSVGDDYVLIDKGPIRRAHVLFSTMKQDAGGLLRAGLDPRDQKGEPNWQQKFVFEPSCIRQDALTDQMELVGILLPRIAHQRRTTFSPARPMDAMLALAPSGLFQLPGCTERGARFFANLSRELPAWHLNLSENPTEIADAIHGFFNKREVALVG